VDGRCPIDIWAYGEESGARLKRRSRKRYGSSPCNGGDCSPGRIASVIDVA
jgi:hypothetical protein